MVDAMNDLPIFPLSPQRRAGNAGELMSPFLEAAINQYQMGAGR